ncbi:MAG: ArnT family glycosyltransferase [Planctomycetaceae bacterium]
MTPTAAGSDRAQPRAAAGLLLIGLLFLAWRLPSMYREPGWQDEECHAVPGLTILATGVPRLPHLPSRSTQSLYYRADEVVFLEPPLFFYAQAAFYALLPHVYGTARLASAAGWVLLLVLAGKLAVRSGGTARAALWGMGLFMMSRWFYFPASAARPDMLCSALGLMAVLATETWTRTRQWRWLTAAGAAIGLGGLTHPFALAYAVQLAVWSCLAARRRQRLLAPALLAAVALLVASSWLLLIQSNPQVFEIQFRNQFIHDRGGPLMERLLWPWESFAFHTGFLWPHMAAWQFSLPVAGAVLCLVLGRRERRPLLSTVGWLAISGAGLISVLVGPHHPVFGYFSYPAALAFIGVGCGIDRAMSALSARRRFARATVAAFGIACVISMLPGSRIRMNLAYFRNWNEVNFNAPRFARSLLDELPPDAMYLVDEEFALDFVEAGRNVIAFRAVHEEAVPRSTPYDYRIASRSTERYFAHVQWQDELAWIAGDPDNPYGCFAKVYRRTP